MVSGVDPVAVTNRNASPSRRENEREFGLAQSRRRISHGSQHRLEVEDRAADYLQHVARRGLIFERLFEVARALPQFAQEPRVFDRYNRLVGECRHQLDLLVSEPFNPFARKAEHADHHALAHHRHAEHCATVIQEVWIGGVSTRRVDELLQVPQVTCPPTAAELGDSNQGQGRQIGAPSPQLAGALGLLADPRRRG